MENMGSNTNFNTLAAFVDSQADLVTKQDLADLKSELKQDISNLSWQIRGIIAMQALKECRDARRPPSESRTLFLALSARVI
jgi:hypothetical protein